MALTFEEEMKLEKHKHNLKEAMEKLKHCCKMEQLNEEKEIARIQMLRTSDQEVISDAEYEIRQEGNYVKSRRFDESAGSSDQEREEVPESDSR